MKVAIRCMQDSDIEEVYSIETSVHISPWSKSILRDCLLAGYNCHVLEITKKLQPIIAGYLICRIKDNLCHILNFGIAKAFQSQGFGRKLLHTFLYSLANSSNTQTVILEVRASNAVAIHLYTSLGFEKKEIKKDYYKDDNQVEDAILLEKFLS